MRLLILGLLLAGKTAPTTRTPDPTPVPSGFEECVPPKGAWATVIAKDLHGEAELGQRGEGAGWTDLFFDPKGDVRRNDGTQPFRIGEPVQIASVEERPGDGSWLLNIKTVFKHNLTRGRGAYEHKSAERILLSVVFERASEDEPYDCAVVSSTWARYFSPLDASAAGKMIAANPSGVITDEIKLGMSAAEVEAVFGTPDRKADLGAKLVYFYPKLKVTFVSGKVSDVD